MKTLKKYLVILIVLAIVSLSVFRLFNNKKQLDNELKAMSEYSSAIPVEIILPKIQESVLIIKENGVLRSGTKIDITSETSGKITYVNGNIGENVVIGQTLIKIEKNVIESQFKLAKISLENAKKNLKRFKNLVGSEAVTQKQMEDIKLNYQNALTNYTSKKKQLENTQIKSPVNGIIAKRFVEVGDNLVPSMQVFSILGKNKLIFVVKIAETDLQKIQKGQKVSVILDIIHEKTYVGNVQSISVMPDMSGRYEVEISILRQDKHLRPGLNGTAIFQDISVDKGIVIPRKCIAGSINDAEIFLLKGDSVISRKVRATALNENETLVTEGLALNEKVVLSGQINLQNGTKVQVLNQ